MVMMMVMMMMNLSISREKYLKIDWSVKMPLHWLIMRVAGC